MDYKKIAIEEFIKPKLINKVEELLEKGKSVHDACDKLEEIFDGTDLKPLDAGTNRYIFTHNKLKGVVFKIAADKHGVEANYREFYVSDMDERIVTTYSINETGSILVEERVKRFRTPEEFSPWKDDIIKMLWKLHKKVLLVDCKLSNFKNFGLRRKDNGKWMTVLLNV